MISPYAPTSLIYAASARKHRPPSHPVLRGRPATPAEIQSLAIEADFWTSIATNIRQARIERGWSQARLGTIVRRSSVTVCKWETLQTRPDAWTIERLERLFGRRLRP